MFKFNCFCIDLTQFDSEEQILEFLKSNNIAQYIDANNLYEAKIGVFTHGVTINKVWVDSVTYCVTAYKTDDESKFTVQFVDYMNSIEPLGFGEGVTQLTPPTSSSNNRKNITIDEILDKINNFGFDSLTDEELDILKSQ
jgi:hypothetical protein